jgi:dihydrofolate reductase
MTENAHKIIVWMQTSLDGRTAGPQGEFDWPVVGPELHAHIVDTLRGAGMFLYGRRVFEMMASFWPIADELPDSTPMQSEYARIWRPMPKLVFSRTVEQAGWNAEVLDAVDDRLVERRDGAGGDLYLFGGAEVVAELARHDLVDEYQLFVHPIVLGGGTPLFPDLTERHDLALVGSRVFDDRVVGLRYARAR